jgi:dihydropteroate synthase
VTQLLERPQQLCENFFAEIGHRRLVMGILNLTPDSFSDGGLYVDVEAAATQARGMVADGAAMIDIGAESTRPGAQEISAEDEWMRLAPALGRLVAEIDAPFSIDTYKAQTARRALACGVGLVNDVWGLQRDPEMAAVVADSGAALAIMHNRHGVDPGLDIVADMQRFFDVSLALADRAGVARSRILLDPGIGFGKTLAQNLKALQATDVLAARYGLPLLIGVSRKRLFGDLLGAPVEARLIGTLAANLATATRGAAVFRVHDVAEHVAAFKILDAIDSA